MREAPESLSEKIRDESLIERRRPDDGETMLALTGDHQLLQRRRHATIAVRTWPHPLVISCAICHSGLHTKEEEKKVPMIITFRKSGSVVSMVSSRNDG